MTWKTYRVVTLFGTEDFQSQKPPHHFDVAQRAAVIAERCGGPIEKARVHLMRPELDGTMSEGEGAVLMPIHNGTAWKLAGPGEPDPGRVHAQHGPDQGLGAEGAEAEPRKTAGDAVAAVNRGRVGSLAIPHSREYLEALRRQVQDWLAAIEEELGTSSVDPAVDAYGILAREAVGAGIKVSGGMYRCPTGARIDLNGMADELAEVGSADVRTHRTGRPRARELDRVLAAWRSAGLEIYA